MAVIFLLRKPDIRRSLIVPLRTFFSSVWLFEPVAVAVAWAAGTVLVLRRVGYWDAEMTKLSAVWFVGFALLFIFRTKRTDWRYYRRLMLDNLGLVVAVEFVSNLHTFPLPVELLLIPLAFLFVGVQAVADSKPEYANVRTATAWCLGILGVASLSFSLAYLIGHFDEVATIDKAKELLPPLVLTACVTPFLVGLRFVVVYETMLHMIRFGLRDNEHL